jgi:hypothetical protein
MDAALQLIEDTGVALRREMLALGAVHRDIQASLRAGVLRRVRHGAFTTPDRWDGATDLARNRLMCVAVARSLGDKVALTHTSALVAREIPVWGADLTKVHVTRLDGATGRTNAGVVHHEGSIAPADIEVVDGLRVAVADRAVIEHASIVSVESGLVSADAALHAQTCDPDSVARRFRAMEHWPGTQHVHLVVRLADGHAESPGETRSRYLCWRHHLPAPILQFEVYDESGLLIGRCDFAWPEHQLLGEFDGRLKYGRGLLPGQTIDEAVFLEKRREDRLREVTNWRMVRLVWSDLSLGAHTANRIRRQMRIAA